MPRRVLGYARVSSEEQARGTSLTDQQASIQAHAQGRGLKVQRFYVEAESGIRAKAEKREQMQALMRDVREGDLVLCDKLDRWSRDPEFTYSSVRQILERGAGFYAVADRLDPSTPEGDTALGFRILFAREEHKRIKERMVGTRRLLRDQGYYVEGVPPIGYRRAHPRGHKGLEKNVLVVDEAEAELVRRMFRMAIAGRSMNQIADELGLKFDRVKNALNRRVYVGEIQNSRDEWIEGRHPAIIDVSTFIKARDAISGRRLGDVRPRSEARTSGWILRDVAMCALCGARMSAAYGNTQVYYRCRQRCTSHYVPVVKVEAEAAAMVLGRLQELRAGLSKAPAPTKATDPTAKLAKVAQKRARLLDAFAEGLLDREELKARLERLDEERFRLTTTAPTVDPKARREMLAEVRKLEMAWTHASGEERRQVVNDLVTRADLATDQPPVLHWRATEDLSAEE